MHLMELCVIKDQGGVNTATKPVLRAKMNKDFRGFNVRKLESLLRFQQNKNNAVDHFISNMMEHR